MGSDFSKHICCVICGRCKKQHLEEESSETKPILQTSEGTLVCTDAQPSTPALEVSKQGSEEVQSLSQDQWLSADAMKVNMENCCVADPLGMTERWEAAWGSTDFLEASEDEETKREVQVLTQEDSQEVKEKMGNAEAKIKHVPHASEAQPVTHTPQDANLLTDREQPGEQPLEAGRERSPWAGIPLQERDNLSLMEFTSETAAGQDCVINPPAEAGGSLLLLCAVQMAEDTETYPSEQVEEMDRAEPVEINPLSSLRSEITPLVETATLVAVQEARETVDPLEVVANGMTEMYSTAPVPWEPLYPQGESLESVNQLLDFLQQDTQSGMLSAEEMESLCCAEPALPQSSYGVLGELEDEESRECDAETAAGEAEPQHRIMPQTPELPEEPQACVQLSAKQEAEFLNVAPSLPEVLGSSTETEAEDIEA